VARQPAADRALMAQTGSRRAFHRPDAKLCASGFPVACRRDLERAGGRLARLQRAWAEPYTGRVPDGGCGLRRGFAGAPSWSERVLLARAA
jgi:hypothetical protein